MLTFHKGFALANGSDKHAFAILADHPDRARRFGNAMKGWTEGTGYDLKYLVDGVPWGGLGEGLVVDVKHPLFALTRLLLTLAI